MFWHQKETLKIVQPSTIALQKKKSRPREVKTFSQIIEYSSTGIKLMFHYLFKNLHSLI